MYFYYVVFVILIIICWLGNYNRRWRPALLIIAAVMLFIIAAFRGEGIDKDYDSYIKLFNSMMPLSYYLSNLGDLFGKDPAIIVIGSVIKYLINDQVTYLIAIFALLGVSLKTIAIKRMSEFWLISILLYYSSYYLLHEMTQIRVGVACGFLLLSIPSIVDKKPAKYLMYLTAGALFHYSSLIFMPLYFINSKKLNEKVYIIIIIFSMLFPLTHLSFHPLFALLGSDNPLMPRYYLYTSTQAEGMLGKSNLLNVLILINVAVAVLFLLKWRILNSINKYAIVLIKIHVFSIMLFYIFYDVGAFGFRFFEILNVVQIILFPFAISIFREKKLLIIGVIICAGCFLTLNLLHKGGLLGPYTYIR